MSIVITGNPGVGKHTITHKIAERLDLSIIDINEIAKNAGLFEKTENTNDVDTEKLGKILEDIISEKNIIVGHLAPYVLDKNQVKIMIVLRRNPYDLISVYKERKYTDQKIKENTGSEILGIIAYDSIKKFGKKKCYQIDTTSKTVPKITKTVMNIIEGKFESDTIDWLTLISNKNDLKKFFSY